MEVVETKWFEIRRLGNEESIKLRMFLFPPAGSDLSLYSRWENFLPRDVELLLVHLPGRGARQDEDLIDDAKTLICNMVDEMHGYLDKPYVLFGHSMGALLAYIMAEEICQREMKAPDCIFISSLKVPDKLKGKEGCFAGIIDNRACLYELDDEELKEKLAQLGGAPAVVLNDKDFIKTILPVFRNDLRLCETYAPQTKTVLPIPFELYGGNNDKLVSKSELEEWKQYTSKEANVTTFLGGHFYFQKNTNVFLFKLGKKLQDIVRDNATK